MAQQDSNDVHFYSEEKGFWFEQNDKILENHLKSRLPAVLRKMDLPDSYITATDFWGKLRQSIEVIEQAFDKYDHLSLSFNGGKDSIVMLNLVLWVMHRRHWQQKPSCAEQQKHLTIFHFGMADEFQEMQRFISDSQNVYHQYMAMSATEAPSENKSSTQRELFVIEGHKGDYKNCLEQLLQQCPALQAVFMGVRRTDPHGAKAQSFELTTPGWPTLMRVNPILEWDYHDVWILLLAFDIPYCQLYDQGYTSLGSIDNTIPNPALQVDDQKYLPAYHLRDGNRERESRRHVPKQYLNNQAETVTRLNS